MTQKKRGEIQHEGKAVENVSKATERVRKGKRIERIVSCRKSCKPSSTVPRRDGGSRGETANKSQDFSFFFFPFLFCRGEAEKSLLNPLAGQSMALFPLCKTTAGQYNLSVAALPLQLYKYTHSLSFCVAMTSQVMDSADCCAQSYTVHTVLHGSAGRYFLFTSHYLLTPRSWDFSFSFLLIHSRAFVLSVDSPLVVASDKALWVIKEHRVKNTLCSPFLFFHTHIVRFF